jgi:hypothetical protein
MADEIESFIQTWNSITTARATSITARASVAQLQMLYDAMSPEAKARVDAAIAERQRAALRQANRRDVKLFILIFATIYVLAMVYGRP